MDRPATGEDSALDGAEGGGESLPPPEAGRRCDDGTSWILIIAWFGVVALVVAIVLLARL